MISVDDQLLRAVRLFEQGQIFAGSILADGNFIAAVHESPQLSLGLTGNATPTALHSATDAPFFELKGTIESILSLFTPPGGPSAISFKAEAPAPAAPGGRVG